MHGEDGEGEGWERQKGTRRGINRRERKRGGGEVRGDNKTRESDRQRHRETERDTQISTREGRQGRCCREAGLGKKSWGQVPEGGRCLALGDQRGSLVSDQTWAPVCSSAPLFYR